MPPIQISEQSEFFIAICKRSIHSYVTLGVRNGNDVFVLASLGKVGSAAASPCGLMFWGVPAHIRNENYMFGQNPKHKDVKYKAYAIQYKHYLDFIGYMKSLPVFNRTYGTSDNLLGAYCPTPEDPNTLRWDLFQHVEPEAQVASATDINSHAGLNLSNTCRHSAIHLAQEAIHQRELGRGISSLFFRSPPLNAVFVDGKLNKQPHYFYILPLPPTAFASLPATELNIVSKLYRRLDEMVLIEHQSALTHQKFERMKELYNQLTSKQQVTISDIMNGIEAWEAKNKALISTHRQSHWIPFRTATQTMFDSFHAEFKVIREAQGPK